MKRSLLIFLLFFNNIVISNNADEQKKSYEYKIFTNGLTMFAALFAAENIFQENNSKKLAFKGIMIIGLSLLIPPILIQQAKSRKMIEIPEDTYKYFSEHFGIGFITSGTILTILGVGGLAIGLDS